MTANTWLAMLGRACVRLAVLAWLGGAASFVLHAQPNAQPDVQPKVQPDLVLHWVTEAGAPVPADSTKGVTLHVSRWVDGMSRQFIQGHDLVVDDSGWSRWPDVDEGVYTLECLPWSWTLVVEASETKRQDTLVLEWPNRRPRTLRGNFAPVRYGPRWDATETATPHPGTWVAEGNARLQSQLDSLNLDQLLAVGAVGSGNEQKRAFQRLEKAVLEGRAWVASRESVLAVPGLWSDLWAQSLFEWEVSLGQTVSTAWERMAAGDARSWTQRIQSPGWCSSWRLAHERWLEPLEQAGTPWREWAARGLADSLQAATGWDANELHVAMWHGVEEPWSRVAEAWWETRWRDRCEVADIRRQSEQAKRHALTAQAWGDKLWMLPNGDLEPAWAGDEGRWTVWLVTKDGSSSGASEWALLRANFASAGLKHCTWGVLSVDDHEAAWGRTLKQRESIKERVCWVGRDPGWWDRLDLLGVPQVVVVGPDGEILTHHGKLPSEGLMPWLRQLERAVR